MKLYSCFQNFGFVLSTFIFNAGYGVNAGRMYEDFAASNAPVLAIGSTPSNTGNKLKKKAKLIRGRPFSAGRKRPQSARARQRSNNNQSSSSAQANNMDALARPKRPNSAGRRRGERVVNYPFIHQNMF